MTVAKWAAEAERKRLNEQNCRLGALLDQIRDSAALFGHDGRILYCNRRATQALREAIGVPRGQIIGRTPAELGVSSEILIGRPIEELEALARAHESFEMHAWGRALEGQLDAIYRADGTVNAVGLTVRNVHQRKLTETRLSLLTKLSALSGMLECDEVAEALVRVPIPRVRRLVRDHLHREQEDRPHLPGSLRSVEGAAAGRAHARPSDLGPAPALAGNADDRLSAPHRGER